MNVFSKALKAVGNALGNKETPAENVRPADVSAEVIEDTPILVTNEVITAPMKAKAIPLQEMDDPAFSEEMMGKGIAFIPHTGELVSPVCGRVEKMFATKHGVILRSNQGAELLIHVGINTVKLKGQHFEAHVETGEIVQAGDKLLTFDLAEIAKTYDITTAMVVTNTPEYSTVEHVVLGEVSMLQPVLEVKV